MKMRTYYRERHAQWTSSALRVGDQHFALDQLEYVWRTNGQVAHRRILVAVTVLGGAVGVRLAVTYALSVDRLRGPVQRSLSAHLNAATVVLVGLVVMGVAV